MQAPHCVYRQDEQGQWKLLPREQYPPKKDDEYGSERTRQRIVDVKLTNEVHGAINASRDTTKAWKVTLEDGTTRIVILPFDELGTTNG